MLDSNSSDARQPASVPGSLTLVAVLILGLVAMNQTGDFTEQPAFLLLYPVAFGLCIWMVVRLTRQRIPKGAFTPANQVAISAGIVLATSLGLTVVGALTPFVGIFLSVAYLVLAPTLGVLVVWFVVALIRGKGWTGTARIDRDRGAN